MYKLTACFVLLTLLVFTGLQATAQNNKLPGMHWLTGTWVMQMKNGAAYETWHYVNDSTYKSEAYIVKATGDTIPQEKVMLVYRNGEMFYMPIVNGQNDGQAVSFKITSAKADEFVAENPQHDFPQRIIYILKDTTHLYARIEGMNKGKFEKEEYNMSRSTKQ